MATHSSVLPAESQGQKSRVGCCPWGRTESDMTEAIEQQQQHIYREREGDGTPLQYSCLGKSHGRRSLVGCSSWGCKEQDTTERLHFHFTFMHQRRKWQPIPMFLPGESQGRGSLVGCCLWGHTESDTTEVTQQQQEQSQSLERIMWLTTIILTPLKNILLNTSDIKAKSAEELSFGKQSSFFRMYLKELF